MNYSCKIKTLSPVHIGTGNEIPTAEYVLRSNKFQRVDMNSLFRDKKFNNDRYIKKSDEGFIVMEEFDKNTAIKHPRYKIDIGSQEKRELKNSLHHWSGNIQEQIKSTDKPYIPGSTIKGALRTTIAGSVIKNNSKIREKVEEKISALFNVRSIGYKKADDHIMKIISGEDPKHDLYKSLQVSDTEKAKLEKLTIGMSTVLSTKSRKSYGWKNFGRRGKVKDPFDATPTFIEALKPEKTLEFSIKTDDWLLKNENDDIVEELGFKRKKQFIDNLPELSQEHALDIIEAELDFYQQYKKPKKLDNIINWYKSLKNDVKTMDNTEFPLRVGWGTGWLDKTIGYLYKLDILQSDLYKLRKRFNLGSKKVPEFPKTRRIVFENGTKYPLGWIKIKMEERE